MLRTFKAVLPDGQTVTHKTEKHIDCAIAVQYPYGWRVNGWYPSIKNAQPYQKEIKAQIGEGIVVNVQTVFVIEEEVR